MRRSWSSNNNPKLVIARQRSANSNDTDAVFHKKSSSVGGVTRSRLESASHLRSLLHEVNNSNHASSQPRNTRSPKNSRHGTVSAAGGTSSNTNEEESSVRRIRSAPVIRKIRSGTLSAISSNNSIASSLSGGGGSSYQTNVFIAQRSNGATVKTYLAEIKKLCQDAENEKDSTLQPPIEQIASLSHLSVDAYYKVVISKYQGIQALCAAMRTFPDNPDLQACCCACLKNLSNIVAIQNARGHLYCIDAMRNHPTSIQVQSEACQLLNHLQSELVMSSRSGDDAFDRDDDSSSTDRINRDEFQALLSHAQNMYLTTKGKESCAALLQLLSNQNSAGEETTTTAETETETGDSNNVVVAPTEQAQNSMDGTESTPAPASLGESDISHKVKDNDDS